MRDHYRTRLWVLRPCRIDDVLFSDTFLSYVCSIRGYRCFQMFACKYSNFERIHLMSREANTPEAYEDTIRSIGDPNKTITDNAAVLTGLKQTPINHIYCIEYGLTIPLHQHQNYSKGGGGNFKFVILKLYHNTSHALISYWCFSANYLDKCRCFLS